MGGGTTPDRSTANLGIVGELIGMLLKHCRTLWLTRLCQSSMKSYLLVDNYPVSVSALGSVFKSVGKAAVKCVRMNIKYS